MLSAMAFPRGVEDSMKGAVIGTAAPPIAVGLVGAILNGLKCSIITNMIMNVINPCSLMTRVLLGVVYITKLRLLGNMPLCLMPR